MNWTEEQVAEHNARLRMAIATDTITGTGMQYLAGSRRGNTSSLKKTSIEPFSGPLDVTLVLHGHCPSKKNEWTRGASGMRLPEEVKSQIGILTTQALFWWKQRPPVEHPEMTFTFYVKDGRRDRDGILVTVLDCLQAAGVLVNDNISRSNARLVLEPCVFVEESEERVEIRLVKK